MTSEQILSAVRFALVQLDPVVDINTNTEMEPALALLIMEATRNLHMAALYLENQEGEAGA